MSILAIETDGLTKVYANGRGCRDVTIQVREGEAFGFLGPNGAGKSTFVKMLVGLIRPSGGHASLFGEQAGTLAAKRLIGYLPELYRYQEWLSGEEVVRLHAKLCGIGRAEADRRIPKLLEEVGIGLRGRDRVKNYSKGMQQRLGLACALVNEPRILFLDEPASALDPIGRTEVRSLLQRLKAGGVTLFLNSHLLEDVEVLCDRMALLNNGEVLRTGTVAEVLEEKSRWRFRVGGFSASNLLWLREETGFDLTVHQAPGEGLSSYGETVWLEAKLDNDEQAGWVNALIVEQGMTLYEVTRNKTRLEEWFVSAVSGLSHRGERL